MDGLLRAVAWLLIVAGLLVAGARYTMIRWWQVPIDDSTLGASIEPTLHAGDWVLLWRLSAPGFGDLVACPDPEDSSRMVIGRLAGESDDAVRIKGNDVYVNGSKAGSETACQDRIFTVEDPTSGEDVDQQCTIEVMGGIRHQTGLGPPNKMLARESTHPVGKGEIWLLSDNRLFPFDSRNFGPLDQETCRETVFFRLVSKDGFLDVKNRLSLIR